MSGIATVAWAGPAADIAQADRQAVQAINDGNLDAFMALYADDAVLTPSGAPFRIEGKEAIRSFFAGLFSELPQSPIRRTAAHDPRLRQHGNP